tara:strand:+ start:10176 stop:10784 length:609 start_codon:yes stop_codon:yes gene_type:complete
LYAEDLAELCNLDGASLRRALEKRPKGSKAAVALLPDIETVQWHHAREEFVGMELRGETPKVKGAIVGSERGKRVWCIWTRMWSAERKDNTFHLLRLVIEDGGWEDTAASHPNSSSVDYSHDAAIAALMTFAQQEAHEWDMEQVQIWNPSLVTVRAAQRLDPKAKVVDRDVESIASLQWFPDHDGPMADKVDWIANEKYGWC